MAEHRHFVADIERLMDRRLAREQGSSKTAVVKVKKEVPKGKSKQEEEGWLANTVKMGTDLQEDARSNFEKQWKQGLMGVEQLSPVSVLSEQTKTQIKGKLKANALPLTKLGFSAAVYCCLFHELKRGLKHAFRDVRHVGPVVTYTCDVALATPLFGPIFGVLLRVALPF